MEEKLSEACSFGQLEKVIATLEQNPNLDVNWKNTAGDTCLHEACYYNHEKIVQLLLAHPNINVNVKDAHMLSPLHKACYSGGSHVVRLLLKDSRVLDNETNAFGHTPLSLAAYMNSVRVIKCWIASGRDLDIGKKGGNAEEQDAIVLAKKWRRTEVISLFMNFKANRSHTVHLMKLELGYYDQLAAEVFALAVFVCDGLLALSLPGESSSSPAHIASRRFFGIAQQLPMELQMILCHRVVGSPKDLVLLEDSERAIKDLAHILFLHQLARFKCMLYLF